MPRVSVIIPTHNDQEFIAEAIESVLNQTFHDLEIIVVNDGSTDETEQRLAVFRSKIRYQYQDCQGPGSSRNWAIRASQSPLIAFLDSDDIWLPAKLENQVSFADKNPSFGIITTDVEWFGQTGVLNSSLKSIYPISSGFILDKLLFDNWITTSAALIRRECFGTCGWFDEEKGVFGEDWMMWMQIAAKYPVKFLDQVLTRRRLRSTSFEHRNAEAQFQGLFRNLDRLQAIIPELAQKPELFREAAYRICLKRGIDDLTALNVQGARSKLSRAVSYKPYSPQALSLYGVSLLPSQILNFIRQVSRSRG